ncbi:MAG: hypothetical protein ABJL44_19065 [Algibacter sp.]
MLFFKRTKSKNEIITYCGYGYCDATIPKKYNCLINSDNLDQPINIKATIKFVIWNGILPIGTIDHGHRTICIISFDGGIPKELNKLPNWNDLRKGNYEYNKFGLCDKKGLEINC